MDTILSYLLGTASNLPQAFDLLTWLTAFVAVGFAAVAYLGVRK